MSTAAHPSGQGTWAMLQALARRYPGRSATVLAALLLASLLDGLGLSTLLSLISLASDGDGSGDPSLPEQMINGVFAALGVSPSLNWLLALGITLVLFKAAVVLLANRQVGYAVANVATDLRLDLVRAVVASRWRYYLSKPIGALANSMATEAQRASEGYLQGAIMAAQALTATVYLGLALMISWPVTLTALVASVIVLGGLNRLVRKAGKAGRKQTGLLKHILSAMTDQLAAIKPLKAMAREDRFDVLVSGQTRELNRSLRKQVVAKEAMKALQEAGLVILAAVGLAVMLGTLGMQPAEVMVLIFLLARIVTLLSKAQRAWQHMAIAESAFWSLTTAIEDARAEREPERGELQPSLRRAIRFDRVSFAHPGQPVLDNQQLEIRHGQLTVITGPSGAGKTTLIDLVAGLLHPEAGRILIDDTELIHIDHRAWRRMIGYVPQEALLVNDSVFNNIALGAPDLGEREVRIALEKADAWEFVRGMQGALQANIGERGGRLSGGQRQRLAIARALVREPALLILDEATSNLDHASEQTVLATIARLRGELTMLAVTHQPGLLQLADRIYHIEHGQVRQVGPDDAPR